MRETWREWAVSWGKVWALFLLLWAIVGLGLLLRCLGFRLAEDAGERREAVRHG